MSQIIPEPDADRVYLAYRTYDGWQLVPVVLGLTPGEVAAGLSTTVTRDRRAS